MKVNLFNSKNPNGKRVPVTIIIEHSDIVSTNDGELLYLLSLHTGIIGTNGKQIDPVYVNGITESLLLEEINKGLVTIGSKVDWGALELDTHAPIIIELSPKNNETSTSIDSHINITMKDPFPASFIDANTIKLKVNGIDVTNELRLKQNGMEIFLTWIPVKIE